MLIDDLMNCTRADQQASEEQIDLFADFNGLPDDSARTEFYQQDANTVGDVTLGLDIDPETGTADSGDLAIDLPNLFVAVSEAAQERKAAVAVLIDEIQYFDRKELGALIMAMHRLQQHRLPVVLVGAGLPILPALAGESKSYAERAWTPISSACASTG